MKDFSGKVALVTGTTGIGRAVAKRFGAGGASVVACGIDGAANQGLTKEAAALQLILRVEACDVSKPDQVHSVVSKTVSAFAHGGKAASGTSTSRNTQWNTARVMATLR